MVLKFGKLLFVSLVIFLASCSNPAKNLVGVWKVADVETQFDEGKMTPAMIDQVVEMQKKTYFKISSDSLLVIISDNNTHEAKWAFDNDNSQLNYFFSTNPTKVNKLGVLIDGKIVSETQTPIGKMVITYAKE